MPSDLAFKTLNKVHRTILKVSGGKLGWTAGNMPVLELTTRGRKTGQARTVMLTSPLQEGDTIVIVASRGGNDHNPRWLLNLGDNPEVIVRWKGNPPQAMTASIATPEVRQRLWPIVEEAYNGYATYQKRIQREIPLVLLNPA